MNNIPHSGCAFIPSHMLRRVAEQTEHEASDAARATLDQMRKLATQRARTLIDVPTASKARRVKGGAER